MQAIAGSVAFSGNSKPLEKLERDLTGKGGGVAGELQRRLKGLVAAGMVRRK